MPNNDKTGPEGKGPQTGRGLGKCDNSSGNDKGHGRRRGRGHRGGFGKGDSENCRRRERKSFDDKKNEE